MHRVLKYTNFEKKSIRDKSVCGGVKKFHASVVSRVEATIDELTQEFEKFSTLSKADIRRVIVALENVIQNKLSKGKIVRLEKLGSLHPALSSKGVTRRLR